MTLDSIDADDGDDTVGMQKCDSNENNKRWPIELNLIQWTGGIVERLFLFTSSMESENKSIPLSKTVCTSLAIVRIYLSRFVCVLFLIAWYHCTQFANVHSAKNAVQSATITNLNWIAQISL